MNVMPDTFAKITVTVKGVRTEAKDVISLELASEDGEALPSYEPGAHLDLHLPHGMVRQYSLCRPFQSGAPYEVAVGLAETSRGGSRWIHEILQVGDRLAISPPRSNFRMSSSEEPVLLMAGGIGITPLLCMADAASQQGRPWHLAYSARSPDHLAFRERLTGLRGGVVTRHALSDTGQHMDAAAWLADHPQVNVYVCGPEPMRQAIADALGADGAHRLHSEAFAPAQQRAVEENTALTVHLAREGITLDIGPDKSILDVLDEEGVIHPWSCREGMCGTCEAQVLEGTPDHRCTVLSEEERADGKRMMVCVSRAFSKHLVLDI
ncbi:MAG: PDR/VanB family oxidoreductase [Sulfitobacter sp.]